MRRRSASPEVLIAFAVFAVAAASLAVLRSATAPHYRLSKRQAIAAARRDPEDARFLRRHPATRAEAIPLDRRLRRVTFFAGPRVVLDAAVAPDGRVRFRQEHRPGGVESGSRVANSPWLLALLTALFCLATAVVPLRRLRNLDVAVLASFAVTVALLNARLLSASVLVATPALAYLAVRCAVAGLRRGTGAAAPVAATPLFDRLTEAWPPERRGRMLRLITGATGLAFLIVTLTSTGESDVAAASLSGATNLLHGQLPYGHIVEGVVHGDTYPLLNYVLYIPGAAWLPVTDAFSDLSGALPVAAAAGLLAAWGLHRLAARLGGSPTAGTRAVLAWLAFPPVLLAASGGSNDLALAALLTALLVVADGAAASGAVLAAAAWTKVAPLILLALWLARLRGRSLARALIALAAVTIALVAALLALGGAGGARQMVSGLSFQFQRASYHAPWQPFGLGWLQVGLQAALLALLAVVTLRAWREPSLRYDLPRLAALGGALLLGVQLSANYWTWAYLPWVFPFVAVALLFTAGPGSASATR